MQYRHEYKHYISFSDYLVIKSRLEAVCGRDHHAGENGKYLIRSLYFDTASDKALQEKISGVSEREKFRIRCYNFDYSFIRLEKKVKKGGLGYKLSAALSREDVKRITEGDTEWMKDSSEALIVELYEKMKYEGLRPKTIVDYEREPFVYQAGNVRITLDYNIRTGAFCRDMLDANAPTAPVTPSTIILEVKYDNFLPDVIRDIVQLRYREGSAFSKYEACRIYG